MEVELKINPVYERLLNLQTPRQIVFGGSSSGKSKFLAQRTVKDVLEGRNYLIVRNVANTIKKSTFNEITKVINDLNLHNYFKANQSDLSFTCSNGYQILSCGLDDVQKVKSITPQKGVVTDIWIEEATEVEYDSYKELTKRLRGVSEFKGSKRITLSFNPILKSHWIYTEFFGNWEDHKTRYKDDRIAILKTTYKDNKFLTAEDIYDLEHEKDEYYYNVYTLGNWGVLGAVIFKNWRVEDLYARKTEDGRRWVDTLDQFHNGLDFGFAEDPAAGVKTYYDSKHKTIYILGELYQTGLTNDVLSERVNDLIGQDYITCDSSEPKSIQELKNNGILALGAKKGKDSVLYGIQWLQQQEIVVDFRCQNTKNEFQQYQWKKDKNGIVLPIPVDKKNHIMDALRYAYEDVAKQRKGPVQVAL